MPIITRIARLSAFIATAAALSFALAGCASHSTGSRPRLMESTSTPADREGCFLCEPDSEETPPRAIELLPTFAATCRPDFQVMRSEPLAFVPVPRPSEFALLPMFGASCAPGSGVRSAIALDLDGTIIDVEP